MMTREELKSLVEVFYHPTFKTFYVNSLDGEEFIHPVGVFVSLGMTTSMKVIETIKDVINTHKGYSACIAEISSKKVATQFMNRVTKINDVSQYELIDLSEDIMDREQAIKELDSLKSRLSEEEDIEVLKTVTPMISKLSGLISKLDKSDSWDGHLIQRNDPDEGYRIFHKFVNYKKEGNLEYRIGIYVTEE